VLIAIVAYTLAFIRKPSALAAFDAPQRARGGGRVGLGGNLACAALILLLAESLAIGSAEGPVDWYPDGSFVEREMAGRASPEERFVRGRVALREGDIKAAESHFQAALAQADSPLRKRRARIGLGEVAIRGGDRPTAVVALSGVPLEDLNSLNGWWLAESLFEIGEPERGLSVMTELVRRYPDDLQLKYHRAKSGFIGGVLEEDALAETIADLAGQPHETTGTELASELSRLVEGARSP